MPRAAPDFYVVGLNPVAGWGGGLTLARQLRAALGDAGQRAVLVGVDQAAETPPTAEGDALNVRPPLPRWTWRVRDGLLPWGLARAAQKLPPPRCGVVALTPGWVLAAKRAWGRDIPVVHALAALLSHCLPCTWPERRPPTFWQRVNLRAIGAAERCALRAADLTLVPTEAAHAAALALEPRTRAVHVYRGGFADAVVDPEARAHLRRQLELPADAVLFLMAGVCDLNKSVAWVVREFAKVEQQGYLAVAGAGPELARVTALVEALQLSHRVRILGHQADVQPWHSAADVVISASWSDLFPEVLKEAFAHGRPVLVPRHAAPAVHAGFAEIVAREGGGLLYDRQRDGALAGAAHQMLRAPHKRKELGRQARRVAEQRHGWKTVVARIFEACGVNSPNDAPECHLLADHRSEAGPDAQRGSQAAPATRAHLGTAGGTPA